MLEGIKINCHSSIKITKSKTIYIDPYRIKEAEHDADFVFITHSHYDHLSIEDILKVAKQDTIYVVTQDSKQQLIEIGISDLNIIIVEPNNKYEVEGLFFKTVPAYNINKEFHPKENNWVGYIINFDKTKYYIAGDTDDIEEIRDIKCDIAFLPIGGTFTMNATEAANLANRLDCKIVVPIHYGELVGTEKDLKEFIDLTKKRVEVLIKK